MSSRDPRISMWAEACELLERAERVQRQFFRLGAVRPGWEPPVDAFETEHELAVMVALPGVAPEQLRVLIDDGVLIVTGERSVPARFRRAAIHRMEIPLGRFERRIALPPGHYALAGQELSDGCLLIVLSKL